MGLVSSLYIIEIIDNVKTNLQVNISTFAEKCPVEHLDTCINKWTSYVLLYKQNSYRFG